MPKCIESNCINEGKIKIKTLDGQVLYVCERHVNLWLEGGCSLVKPFRKRAVDKLKLQGRIIKKIITSPVNVFSEIKDENLGTSYAFYARLIVIFGILTAIIAAVVPWLIFNYIDFLDTLTSTVGISSKFLSTYLDSLDAIFNGFLPLVLLIIIIIGGLIGILVGGIWLHIWVYLCSGRKGIKQTIKAMAYGSTPWLLLGWIPYVGIIGGIWCIITSIIGIKQLHKVSAPKAILAYLLGAIIIPLTMIFLVEFLL